MGSLDVFSALIFGSTMENLLEDVESCGPQWCDLPLPLLESSFKKLFPNSLASLAAVQATCRAFSFAVIEVNSW